MRKRPQRGIWNLSWSFRTEDLTEGFRAWTPAWGDGENVLIFVLLQMFPIIVFFLTCSSKVREMSVCLFWNTQTLCLLWTNEQWFNSLQANNDLKPTQEHKGHGRESTVTWPRPAERWSGGLLQTRKTSSFSSCHVFLGPSFIAGVPF